MRSKFPSISTVRSYSLRGTATALVAVSLITTLLRRNTFKGYAVAINSVSLMTLYAAFAVDIGFPLLLAEDFEENLALNAQVLYDNGESQFNSSLLFQQAPTLSDAAIFVIRRFLAHACPRNLQSCCLDSHRYWPLEATTPQKRRRYLRLPVSITHFYGY